MRVSVFLVRPVTWLLSLSLSFCSLCSFFAIQSHTRTRTRFNATNRMNRSFSLDQFLSSLHWIVYLFSSRMAPHVYHIYELAPNSTPTCSISESCVYNLLLSESLLISTFIPYTLNKYIELWWCADVASDQMKSMLLKKKCENRWN